MPLRRYPAGIVQGQRIFAVKLALAKALRREMTPEARMLWNELRGNGPFEESPADSHASDACA